ncbi:hypothetical protein F5882DRAFT_53581 [Hyaloscypha sp. PMI_1271]|nr:hypothetical protein F5882DRAFT_53581 [Hyaloscypha sp. PMI_1271]
MSLFVSRSTHSTTSRTERDILPRMRSLCRMRYHPRVLELRGCGFQTWRKTLFRLLPWKDQWLQGLLDIVSKCGVQVKGDVKGILDVILCQEGASKLKRSRSTKKPASLSHHLERIRNTKDIASHHQAYEVTNRTTPSPCAPAIGEDKYHRRKGVAAFAFPGSRAEPLPSRGAGWCGVPELNCGEPPSPALRVRIGLLEGAADTF